MLVTVFVWLPIASKMFVIYLKGKKPGSQVGMEKHQRTNDSKYIIVIDTPPLIYPFCCGIDKFWTILDRIID